MTEKRRRLVFGTLALASLVTFVLIAKFLEPPAFPPGDITRITRMEAALDARDHPVIARFDILPADYGNVLAVFRNRQKEPGSPPRPPPPWIYAGHIRT